MSFQFPLGYYTHSIVDRHYSQQLQCLSCQISPSLLNLKCFENTSRLQKYKRGKNLFTKVLMFPVLSFFTCFLRICETFHFKFECLQRIMVRWSQSDGAGAADWMCPPGAGVGDCLRRTLSRDSVSGDRNLCCNVASINSSSPMRRYLTLVDLQKQHAFCFAVLQSGQHWGQLIRMKGRNWRGCIILALSQWSACRMIW